MLHGFFSGHYPNTPFIQLDIGWNQGVQQPYFVLDTGFSGELQVTPTIAKELGLEVAGVTKARIASGQAVDVPTALAVVAMEGVKNVVTVLISESLPLAGIELLTKFGYKVTVDCKYRAVNLEKVS